MTKPSEQNEGSSGLSRNAGNASKNVIKGVLKDSTWYVLIGISIFVLGLIIGLVL